MPDATLFISSYGEFPCNEGEVVLKNFIDQNSNSIFNLGKLSIDKLYVEMSSAEFWLYPTHFHETSCITALEMLMSEVICIYYPIAGLINTVGEYGLSVNKGEEIDTLMSLTDEKKLEIRNKGKEYALNCSWENRYSMWNNLLFGKENGINYCFVNNDDNVKKHVAIFNGFNFHYEMYGFIIEYCKNNNYLLTIFTSFINTLGWFEFYKNHFKNYDFELKNNYEFEEMKDIFDIIFIPTDDDYQFKQEWINEKCITINHLNKIRRPEIKNNVDIRPFIQNSKNWAIPCFNILEEKDKENESSEEIYLSIIGDSNCGYNYDTINKLASSRFINLYIISRSAYNFDITKIDNNKFNVVLLNNLDTQHMINMLRKCDYIFVDNTNNIDHINGVSMCGCIPLAYSTLTPLIISKYNNNLYNFKNVIEFDIDSKTQIIIEKGIIDKYELEKERKQFIYKFDTIVYNLLEKNKINKNLIPKKIIQTWEHKDLNPDFQKMVDIWKTNNPDYEYYLFDKDEREKFISENFDKNIINTYKAIIPGAYKSDLFRYCYLYINGGIYIDIDTLCIGKLDDFLLSNIEFLVPIDLNINPLEGNHNLACGFIASIPKHPILLNCINKIVFHVENNIIPQSKLDFTGPGLLGRSVNIFLKNNETMSFVGKEGIYNNIHFLKFEKISEHIKDSSGNILLQNKNGNQDIIYLYNQECNKLTNYVSWVNTNNIIQNKKNIAIMVYGQFRTYKNNLIKNINMLKPIINNCNVHLFILSDKSKNGNYSQFSEDQIKNIFLSYGFKIHIFDYIENFDFSEEEDKYVETFFNNINDRSGIENEFVPKLIYRKNILNKLKNDYINSNNIEIDLTIYCRLFDVIITNNLSFEKIEHEINHLYNNDNIVFGSSDTLFIGSQKSINYLFDLPNGYIYHNQIWEDQKFLQFISSIDLVLFQTRATYSPEIQYISHIYFSSHFDYKNIRVDFNNIDSQENKYALYNIILDPKRKLFTTNSFILKKDYIEEVNKQIPLQFLNYFSKQGLVDYNMGIGVEHYKLFCCISHQIKNGIIIDIGTHHGNSAISLGYSLTNKNNNLLYSFDIKELIQYSCKNYFEKYKLNYRLENIFDENIKNKYKQLLLSSTMIFIDIDPHNGLLEYEMYLWLKNNNYKGFILYDDIFIEKGHVANNFDKTFANMTDFWNKIPENEKINLTSIGHWSGTGLVCFDFIQNNFILD